MFTDSFTHSLTEFVTNPFTWLSGWFVYRSIHWFIHWSITDSFTGSFSDSSSGVKYWITVLFKDSFTESADSLTDSITCPALIHSPIPSVAKRKIWILIPANDSFTYSFTDSFTDRFTYSLTDSFASIDSLKRFRFMFFFFDKQAVVVNRVNSCFYIWVSLWHDCLSVFRQIFFHGHQHAACFAVTLTTPMLYTIDKAVSHVPTFTDRTRCVLYSWRSAGTHYTTQTLPALLLEYFCGVLL